MVTTRKTKSIFKLFSGQRPGYSETIWLIPIILLGAFLRFYLLDSLTMGGDEVDIVNGALGLVQSLETGNAFLYYPILRLWINIFGQSDFAVRLPAALIGVLTVPLVYKTGKLLLGQKIGLISALLFSISMFHIYYSQQAHSYGLFTFLSLLSFYYLWQAIHHNRRYDWLLFSLSIGLSINIHFFSFFVLLSELIIGAILILPKIRTQSLDRKMWVNVVISIGLITLIIMPVLIQYALPQLLQVMGIIPKTGKRLMRDGVTRFDVSPDLFAWTLRTMTVWRFPDGISLLPHSHLLYDMYLIAFLTGLIYLAIKKLKTGAMLLLWVVLPLLPITFFAQAADITFSPRRLIFILPIYLIIIATGFKVITAKLASLKFIYRPLALALSLVLMVGVFGGFSMRTLQWYYVQGKDMEGFSNWREALLLLNQVAQPGDIVVASKSYLPDYYDGPEQTLLVVPEEALSPANFENIYTSHRRLWYVREGVEGEQLKEIEQWLVKNDFLTFRFAESELFISYKRNQELSEEAMLAEWIDILRQALAIKSRLYLYEAMADVYIRGGHYQEAIALYEQLLASDPQNVGARAGLAKVYEASGQHDAAMTQIEQAIGVAPGNQQIYRTLAYIYTAQGGTAQNFQEIYRRIEAVDPVAAHFTRGLLYVHQGHPVEALDEFNLIVQKYPHHQLAGLAQEWLDRYN